LVKICSPILKKQQEAGKYMEKRQFIKAPLVQNNGTSGPEQQPSSGPQLQSPQPGFKQFSLEPPVQQVAQNSEATAFANRTIPQGFIAPGQQVPMQPQTEGIPFLNPAGPISPHQSVAGVNLFATTNTPQQGPQWSQSGIMPQQPVSPSQSGIMPQQPASQWSQSGITPLLNQSGPISPHQSFAGIDILTPDINTLPVPAVPGRPVMRAGIPMSGTTRRQTGALPQTGDVGPQLPPWAKAGLKHAKKRRFPIWARVVVAVLAVLVLASGSAFVYYQVNYASSISAITGQQAYHLKTSTKEDGTVKQAVPTTVNNTSNVLNGGRINILLLGSDTDGKNGNDIATGTPLAQTDMIITIDPQTKYVGMLSIPRDLQVYIPGYTDGDKVDKAFMDGVGGGGQGPVAQRVGYGAGLAEDTIQANFGIKINYYAWVDIYGFSKVVDTANGVDIDAIHPMVDNSYPDENNKNDINAYKRLYIAPGPQHMDGQQALEYVRTRHADLVGDIGRTARQQQLLSALKQKLANPDVIAEAPQLMKDLDGSLFTDLQPAQIIQIANYARGVDLNKVDRVTMGPPTYASGTQANSNLLPYCEPIKAKLAQMFGLGSQANCIDQTASTASNTSTVTASTPQPANTASAAIASPFAQAGQMLQQTLPNVVSNSTTQIDSLHGLLDLLFMVVFESFDALQF
jgi:LCP family protein required for cell wall assembly